MFEFTIPAMSCGHCVQAVTQAIREADREAKVDIDLATKQVRVETSVQRESVVTRLSEAGYAPK